MSLIDSRQLLVSFAHPDDESFGMGGAIAYYVQRGIEVSLICATNGDAGTVPSQLMQGYQTVGELRLNELRCAAETLGIKTVITYGYRDSGMMGTPDNDHPDCLWQADEDVVTGHIVRDIRRIRPQVVVTFDPWGGYGHPDHIFMHRATTRAFHAAADSSQYPDHLHDGLEPYRPAKLYYNTFPRAILRTQVWLARLRGENPRRMGRNQDIDMVAILQRQLRADARINVGPYQSAWDAASDCHASQMNPRQTHGWIDGLVRLFYRHQYFTRAWPESNGHSPQERDLFDGIS